MSTSEVIGVFTKATGLSGEVTGHILVDHGHFANFDHAQTSKVGTGAEWNESVAILIGDDVERVKLEVRVHHAISAATKHHGLLLLNENVVNKELALDSAGTLHYSCVCLPVQVAAGLAPSFMIPAGFKFKIEGGYNRLVVCNVDRANIVDVSLFGHRDPYVLIEKFHNAEGRDGHKSVVPQIKGKVHWKATHPVFNETFATLIAPDVTGFNVEIKNHHLMTAAGHLGHVEVKTAGRVQSGDFKLEGEPGDVNLHSYHVPLELLAVVAAGKDPFVAPESIKVKTGEGFELPVWYLAPNGECQVEVTAKVNGSVVAEGKLKVPESTLTKVMVPLTPSRVLDVGTPIVITTTLRGHSHHIDTSFTLTVGDE